MKRATKSYHFFRPQFSNINNAEVSGDANFWVESDTGANYVRYWSFVY
jgi:hypothetical protein